MKTSHSTVSNKFLSSRNDGNRLEDLSRGLDYFNNDGKQFILSVALKCADVGHYAKNQELYCLWNDLLIKEYLDLESISEFDYVYKDEEYYNNNIKQVDVQNVFTYFVKPYRIFSPKVKGIAYSFNKFDSCSVNPRKKVDFNFNM